MKRSLLFTALFFAATALHATDYYVSPAGNDNNNGTSPSTPWKTIAKVNSFTFASGDVIRFKRGSIFYGCIVAGMDGLTFDAYDSGDRPMISGYIHISTQKSYTFINGQKIPVASWPGWSQNGNIWSTTIPAASSNLTVVSTGNLSHGLQFALTDVLESARYPNADDPTYPGGYLTYNKLCTGTGSNMTCSKDTIVGTQMPVGTPASWNGADICIKKNNYTIARFSGAQFMNGNQIKLTKIPSINANYSLLYTDFSNGYGYFIRNHDSALDKTREWTFNNATKTLKIVGSNPTSIAFDGLNVCILDKLLDLNYKNNITVQNITFIGANQFGIYSEPAQTRLNNIRISACDFMHIGGRGIGLLGTDKVTVDNCYFGYCLLTGIELYWPSSGLRGSDFSITNCVFEHIAPFPGMGANSENDFGDQSAVAVAGNTWPTNISNNSFEDIGKAAIRWQGGGVTIKNNVINNAVTSFTDYGAIYTWASIPSADTFTNRVINNNIISNCVSDTFGTPHPGYVGGNGIYLDGQTKQVTVKNNTVFNMSRCGIVSNNPVGVTLSGNVLYNNGKGINFSRWVDSVADINININNNTCYATSSNRLNISYTTVGVTTGDSLLQELHNAGSLDSNHYGLVNELPFVVAQSSPVNPMSFENWRTMTGKEAHSTICPTVRFYALDNIGANMIANGNFNTSFTQNSTSAPIYGYPPPPASTPTCNVDWDNGAGNPMVSKPSGRITIPTPWASNSAVRTLARVPSLQPDSAYVLRFTTFGSSVNGILLPILKDRSAVTVYGDTQSSRSFTNSNKMHEFVFKTNSAVPPGIITGGVEIDFQKMSGSPVYIDDLFFAPVRVTQNDPNIVAPLLCNYNATPLTTYMSGYRDALGNLYDDNTPVTLAPFTGMVFFQEPPANRPARTATNPSPIQSPAGIQCYPNPAGTTITISHLATDDHWETVRIMDIKGQWTEIVQKIAGQTSVTLDIASLAPGEYFASFTGNGKAAKVVKFVKL